ncbi:MAG: DNA translocase FtsK 4TM domain-containing protein [Desulfobacterota bacterium]|nr:DNA translocase FtsK 4TM domain-containing protein [Thermodesulfobacteriota bacterium]
MATKKSSTRQSFEVAGIILTGFAVFLTWCLITYDPRDPSFETGLTTIPKDLWKRGGLFGSYMSSFLFQTLGIGAFAVPLMLFTVAFKFLFSPVFSASFYLRSALWLAGFICVETLLSLYCGRLNLAKYTFNAGGAVVGGLIADLLKRYIGVFGAYLLTTLALLLVIMGLTRISYVALWSRIMVPPAQKISTIIDALRRRRKKNAAVRLLEQKRAAAVSARRRIQEEHVIQPRLPLDTEPDAIPITMPEPNGKPVHQRGEEEPEFIPSPEQLPTQYTLPPISLLDDPSEDDIAIDTDALRRDAEILTQKLADFGVTGTVVEISPGPVITRFEFEPAPGIKLNRIISLSDDLSLALKAVSVRIAPIPGKSVVGIEIPNKKRKIVFFKDIIARDDFFASPSRLTFGLGKDIAGAPIISDLSRMPHLLVAGTTGSGKSVFVNTVICSILFKATPDEVRFLMIDPKRLELSPYEGIPHLLHPVVVEPKKAAIALRWAVEEMERRYERIAEKGTRNILQYNKKIDEEEKNGQPHGEGHSRMPYIVVIIDELADLMMIAARDVEGHIARLAQMARAAGIHLLVATQRPSVDIITGLIKANFPSRISFQVSSKVDSRTIIDVMGAEKLLGDGDMLFLPPGTSRLQRIHGAYISEKEIRRITEYVKKQAQPQYDETILATPEENGELPPDDVYDELYDTAVAIVTETRQASISMLQRRMRVGYNRAARMIERMEREGIVGPSDGVKPREVLIDKL